MCNIARINRFLDLWPGAESGPGHIVLGDANLEDEGIDWCLALFDSLLDGTPWPEDAVVRPHVDFSPALYANCDKRELVATRGFLRMMRALPEDDRVELGDQLCESFE